MKYFRIYTMRINDVLKETQQVDELSLGGVGRGIEKGISGLSKATGYVAGIPQGIGKSFQKGKARAVAGLGGELPPTPAKPINPDFAKEYNRLTSRQEPTLDPKAEDLAKQIKQKWAELSQLRDQYKKLTGGAAPAGAPAASSPASEPQSISAAPADQDMKDMAKLAGVPDPTAVSAAPADEPEKASTASDASPAPAKQNRTSADDMEDEWNAAIADFKSQNTTAAAPQAQPASNVPTAGNKKPEATPPSASDVPNPELDRLKQLSGQTPRETPTVDTTKMAAAPAAPTVPNTLTAKKETPPQTPPAQTGIPKPTPSTTSAVKPGGNFQQTPNLGNVKMNAPAGIPKVPASTAATTKAAQDKSAAQNAVKALTGRSVAVKEARKRK